MGRLKARLRTEGLPTTTDQRYFVYDGDQMVLVMDPNGAVQNRYLWGAAVDEILADEQVGGELLWTLTDNLGTVRELVNNTSTVRNHIVYDTYGNVLSETAGGARSAIKFTGRYLDTETGLQWNLNRWYDAKTGRWLSQDPIGFEGGDANLYRYVGNDPGNYVDGSGLVATRDGTRSSEYWQWRIEEAEQHFPGYSARQILEVIQNEMCWEFMHKYPQAVASGLIDEKPPQRQLEWGYIYTAQVGWVDLGHFFTNARAICKDIGQGSDARLALLGWCYEAYSAIAGMNDRTQLGMGSSAFGPEDLYSNRMGREFGRDLRDGVPLSKQFREYFEARGAKRPDEAWNYRLLPESEKVWEDAWQKNPAEAWKRLGYIMDPNFEYWKRVDPNSRLDLEWNRRIWLDIPPSTP